VETFGGTATAYAFSAGAYITVVTSVASVQAMISQQYPVFYVGDPLYTTTGPIGIGNTTNDTAALTAAAAAMATNGSGILLLPPLTLQISTFPTFAANMTNLNLPYAMRGFGQNVSIIKSYASSLANSLGCTATSDFVTSGPAWRGFTIDGTNATSTAVGLHWTDVSDVEFDDVNISNFTLTDSFYFHNINGWSEDIVFSSVTASNSKNILHFAVGSAGYSSFDYWVIDKLYSDVNANQNWITEEASLNTGGTNPLQTLHEGCKIRGTINAHNAATNTGALLNFLGWSAWTNTMFDIHAEVDGGSATSHTSLKFANNNATWQGDGIFTLLGTFQSPSFSGGSYQAEFSGRLTIPGLYPGSGGGITVAGSGGGSVTYISNQPTPPTLTSGTAWTNNLGWDVVLYIPYTLTASSATLKLVQQAYTISAAGATVITSPVVSMAGMLTLRVNNNERIRIDVSTGTIGTVQAFWG
jgi:hypothetical protein